MSETKYGKYFIEYDPGRRPKKVKSPAGFWGKTTPNVVVDIDNTIMPGSNFYKIWLSKPGPVEFKPMSGHPTHIHQYPELLFFLGTNPDDPMDLGAELWMYMGKELEKHVINRTTVVYIPPNFIHAPLTTVKKWRPFIFMEVNQGPVHTEKMYPQLLPREVRERTDWSFWKDDGDYFSLPLTRPDKE